MNETLDRICLNCNYFLPAGLEWTEKGICLADAAFEPYLDALMDGDFASCRQLVQEKKFDGDRESCVLFEELEDAALPDDWLQEVVDRLATPGDSTSRVSGSSFSDHSFFWLLEHDEQLQTLRREHRQYSREERRLAADYVYHAAQAEQLFGDAIGEPSKPAAIPGEVMALAIDPEYAPAILTVGTHEFLLGRHGEAMQLLLSLVDLPLDTKDLAISIDKAGRFLLDRNDHARALNLYTVARLKFPGEQLFRAGIAFCTEPDREGIMAEKDTLEFTCKQCGHCCLNLRDAFCTCATEEDVSQWKEDGREDILAWIDPVSVGDEILAYDIWISPATGDDVARCPWLRKLPGKSKYICRIHGMKPTHCREYPHSREHAEETGCPGFDKQGPPG